MGCSHQAELDLLLFHRGRRLGFEIKYSDAPRITSSQKSALEHLRLDQFWIIVPSEADYPLAEKIQVQGLPQFIQNPLAD